jgi:DNA replication protein DnaC
MSFKSVYRDIIRAYEADRDRAESILDKRRSEVYASVPRLREIDARLAELGLSIVKLAVNDGTGNAADFHAESDALKDERETLLKETGVGKDFLKPAYRCPLCGDTGYISNGALPQERCPCLKQKLTEAYYGLSNVKDILADENFETFNLSYYSVETSENEGISPYENMRTVYGTALRFCERFDGEYLNLLFYGETGLGKTFLCNCVAKELLDKGKTVLYTTAPRLFKIFEDMRFNREEEEEPDEAAEAVTDVDLLIIDDLGAEFPTIITSTAMFDIINQRMLTKKPVVISTNMSPKELESQYSDRIISRFYGSYKILKFFGDDIRVRKKYTEKRI